MIATDKIRNIAIIAHVDHGKTTLVDGLLKQSKAFRDNQAEMSQTTILDTGELERERGITISAKTAAIEYNGYKINIIDTPGHADFSGEVERTLNMADGCLLVVDAQEGPMPQTKFVLAKALALDLKPIVVINKIDKRDVRTQEVMEEIGNLFLDLADHDHQLDYQTLYAVGRDGVAFDHLPTAEEVAKGDLTPIFEAIISGLPAPRVQAEGPFQMLISSLAWDSYLGKYAMGKINRGQLEAGAKLALVDQAGSLQNVTAEKLFTAQGLGRVEVAKAGAGDIVWVTGIASAKIGQTLATAEHPEAMAAMAIEAPTLKIAIGPNTSPLAGLEGKFTTSRQLAGRLKQELETNIGLRVEEQAAKFIVAGRGELHLSVLIETMRREGYEMEVGRPQVVTKEADGVTLEPVEELLIDVPTAHMGAITTELGRRRAELVTMAPGLKGTTSFTYKIPTRALIGLRSQLQTLTRGSVIMNSLLIGYEPLGAALPKLRNGALISFASGEAVIYSLQALEERGTAFIGPGTKVYTGMIIGLNRRTEDMEINVCKEKKLTNVRAAGTDMSVQLTPPKQLSLEEALDFIEDDELLEVTPQHLRLRKRYLTDTDRRHHRNR
ncbi:translational GTPase TypA [Candidatus Microgenomates bacterium]|nr:translational GTPase TypA [Candidatus Microgenomates bacterium]